MHYITQLLTSNKIFIQIVHCTDQLIQNVYYVNIITNEYCHMWNSKTKLINKTCIVPKSIV